MKLHLDTRRYSVTTAEKAARPKAVYEGSGDNARRVEGAQARNDAGIPVWGISVSVSDGDRIETHRLSFPVQSDSAPEFALGQALVIQGLTAVVVNGSTFLTAESVTAKA